MWIPAVLDAAKEVAKCRYLKKMLELVLALGNYMNRGARGNASGFKISSLNKIIDTKSSIDKRITLLHYMLQIIGRKVSVDSYQVWDKETTTIGLWNLHIYIYMYNNLPLCHDIEI